jgi:hypothetical protein
MPATHSVLNPSDAPSTLADKIFDYTMNSLNWARRQLDKEALARAIAVLETAQRIEFFEGLTKGDAFYRSAGGAWHEHSPEPSTASRPPGASAISFELVTHGINPWDLVHQASIRVVEVLDE